MGAGREPRTGHHRGIRRIKAPDGSDVILSGSSTLTSTLLEHGLADELLLVVFPVLLGTGKRIFADGTPPRSFELVSPISRSIV
jgi:dihydrofolate reductase